MLAIKESVWNKTHAFPVLKYFQSFGISFFFLRNLKSQMST